MKTDVNCNLNILAEPSEIAQQVAEGFIQPLLNRRTQASEIAQQVAEGFIQPLLNRRTQVMGQESSDQLYVDLMYKLLLQRVSVIGVGAVGEFNGIAQALLEDIQRVAGQQNASETQLNEREFLNQSGRPS